MTGFPPIAVVGLGAMFPGRGTTAGFWRDLVEAVDTTGPVPATHWLARDYYDPDPTRPDHTYSHRGAFIPAFAFDPVANGTPPSVIETTDTVQLMALHVARAVLAEAEAGLPAPIDRDRISVVLGVATGTELMQDMSGRLARPMLIDAMRADGVDESRIERVAERFAAQFTEWRESTFPGLLGNVVAGRIANRLDLGGVNFTADAACASSLAALRHACVELHEGESDLVLTGGADAMNAIFMYLCFSKTPAMSASGRCSPFSADADGTLMGEGAGLLALRRLADAERDGNAIYAVVRGVGGASDGRATSVYAPHAGGQARAIRRALDRAGIAPESIDLVEAHGTGTRAGDLAEVGGLKAVFGDRADTPWVALGSVKSQIGHTKSAAGAASLIKSVLALHHRVLPPTINVRRPDPRLGLDGSPFHLATRARPWVAPPDRPRRAGVSSFGFGGTNFHAVLEEYRGQGRRPAAFRALPAELVLVSAGSRGELADRLAAIVGSDPAVAGALGAAAAADFAAAAAESQDAFDPGAPVRLGLVVGDLGELRDLTEAVRAGSLPTGAVLAEGQPSPGSLAFLFAGQGSQYVDMGRAVGVHFPAVRDVWDAVAALDPSLSKIVFPPTAFDDDAARTQAAALTDTARAQPALAVTALGQLALLDRLGVRPDAVAGHSFGELMALHAAGVVDAAAAVRLAVARGRAMASVGGGAMLAVGADRATVEPVLATEPDLVLANDNAPAQVVLSGPVEAVERARGRLASLGVPARALPVATAFHSPLVAPAADAFAAALARETLGSPRLPVLANTTAGEYPLDPAPLLAAQLAAPVRFRDTIEALYDRGVRTFVEVGPAATLCGLVGATLGDRPHTALAMDRRGVDGVVQFWRTVAGLAVGGRRLDFAALRADLPVPECAQAPPAYAIWLNGANHGKPYPKSAGAAVVEAGRAAEPGAGPPTSDPPVFSPPESGPSASPPAPTPLAAPALPVSAPSLPPAVPVSVFDPDSRTGLPTMDHETAERLLRVHEAMAREHGRFLEASVRVIDALAATTAVAPAAPVYLELAADSPVLGGAVRPERNGGVVPAAAVSAGGPAYGGAHLAAAVPATTAPATNGSATNGLSTVAAAPTPLAGAASNGAPAAVLQGGSVTDTVIGIVAERTGYPAEMLDPDMDLEADLGIDSIKQVEILSALQELLPGVGEVTSEALSDVRTLGDVARLLGAPPDLGAARAVAAGPDVDAVRAPNPPASAVLLAPSSGPQGDRTSAATGLSGEPHDLGTAATVTEIVAERTGYPVEVLDLDMDLEADLGIDSIKQVEILAALAERRPEAAGIDPAALGEIRTLRDVVVAVERLGPAGAPGVTAPPAPRRPASPDVVADPRLSRRVVVLEERPLDPVPDAVPEIAEPVEITAEAPGVATELAAALVARGIDARVVDVPSERAGSVVVTTGLSDLDPVDAAAAALAAATAAAPAVQRPGAQFVVLQDTGGDFARTSTSPERAALGSMTALAKTAALEWPTARVRAIDVDRTGLDDTAVAARVRQELLGGGLDVEVGLAADGRRLVPVEREGPSGASTPVRALPDGAFVVASGGARGVTAAALIVLARTTRVRYLLLGRTVPVDWPSDLDPDLAPEALRTVLGGRAVADGGGATPREIAALADRMLASREIRRTIAAVEAAGSSAHYVALDVTDATAVSAAVAERRAAWGPVTGLVHGAGVLADRLIRDRTGADDPARAERVLAVKLRGLRSLLDALGEDQPQVVTLFSSVAARYGNPGQADYAMANEALNRVAWALTRRWPEARVSAVNWGPWDGGMVSEAHKERFARRGAAVIPLDAGAAAFVEDVLSGAVDEIETVVAAVAPMPHG